jgi:hypothetical protein
MEMVEHLSKFVDQEVQKAEHGITAEGCIVTPVPQCVVQDFIDSINEQEIEPLNDQIEELEGLNVLEETDDGSDPGGEARPEEAQKADGGSKNPKAGGPIGQSRKRIRAVPKPNGPKAQSSG